MMSFQMSLPYFPTLHRILLLLSMVFHWFSYQSGCFSVCSQWLSRKENCWLLLGEFSVRVRPAARSLHVSLSCHWRPTTETRPVLSSGWTADDDRLSIHVPQAVLWGRDIPQISPSQVWVPHCQRRRDRRHDVSLEQKRGCVSYFQHWTTCNKLAFWRTQ